MSHAILAYMLLALTLIGLSLLGKRLRIPTPFLLLPAGMLLEFIPHFPSMQLNPEIALTLFLPPLIYAGASYGSWQGFCENLRSIMLLAVGLVLMTTVCVAVLAHFIIPGFGWAAGFALGAIISPPDDVAALSIARHLRLPQRIVSILEGEGLANDATSLTVLRFAVAAILTGVFSFWKATAAFGLVVVGEIAYGTALGWVLLRLRSRMRDTAAETAMSLLTPFLSYLPAYWLGGSGVLATVATGLYMSAIGSHRIASDTRLEIRPVWGTITFILDGLLFLLTGLQLRSILGQVSMFSPATLLKYGLGFSALVIVVRFAGIFPVSFIPCRIRTFVMRKKTTPPANAMFIISWAGMRGAISLAAALALPFTLRNGTPFPGRSLIIYITFCVIVTTLLLQGLSLPWLAHLLGVDKMGIAEQASLGLEEEKVRLNAARAVTARLIKIAQSQQHAPHVLARVQDEYDYRIRQFSAHLDGDGDGTALQTGAQDLSLRLDLLQAERDQLLTLNNQGEISDEVLRRVEHDIDLQEMRLKEGIFQWELPNN